VTEWTAGSEAEAMMIRALAASDGFPVPTEAEFAQRVIEQLAALGYRLAPVTSRRRVFQPAALVTGEVPWLHPSRDEIVWTLSPNQPPQDEGDGWSLLYTETIEEVASDT
jgi:hypothetical protein